MGVMTLSGGAVTKNQIEAARLCLKKVLKSIKQVKTKIVWRINIDLPVTQKPLQSRMGKGKGNVHHWVCWLRPGQILFECKLENPWAYPFILNLPKAKFSGHTVIIYAK